ncbi:hypothetical protein Vretimale_9438 [Volvox reticuliferus]|uniref:phosphatidylinositol 3-kinase n=1 Tax=Volvox reticuliferus TaxID=1737510 RepID=A0A8J4CFT0_9CHLO|nr:hypothetical protein Vretifemale_9919 [Volvox reticuliferus]GIM04943.1 hypothetical protein Vretimale_9438 [Volvox reticuliferus]
MWGSAPPARGAAAGTSRGAGQFSFYVSCDINLQVRVKVSELQGLLPSTRSHLSSPAGSIGLIADQTAGLGFDATCPHASPSPTAAPGATAATGGSIVESSATGSTGGGTGNTAAVSVSNSTSALYVTAWLTSCGDTLGLEMETAYTLARCPGAATRAPSTACRTATPSVKGAVGGGGLELPLAPRDGGGGAWTPASELPPAGGAECDATAQWNEWLTFCVKYRDLPRDAQLVLVVVEVTEGRGESLVGSSVMPLFSKRGRLKTGPQRLRVWEGVPPCTANPSSTPGKAPLSRRDRLSRLEHLLGRLQRGEMAPGGDWLDALTLGEIRRLSQLDREAWLTRPELRLTVVLPLFPYPVLSYQHVSYMAAGAAGPAGGTGLAATSTASSKKDAAAALGALPSPDPSVSGGAPGAGSIIRFMDPEVGRDNPAELKAQKLARGLQRGVLDRDLKPNSEERKKLQAILKLPPNKPLHAEERALLWRFRASLTSDTRALTKFLQCVDWSDAAEAKQAAELMRQWAPISAADALELLSPDFRAEVVREHAVQALQNHDPDELSQYLLQLVQALRYEAADGSRLARFLVARAAEDPALAIQLHWYLFCELDDPGFGQRARALHTSLLDTLERRAGHVGLAVKDTIRRQVDLVKQLKAVIRELKSSKIKAARATERLREMISESGPCGELTALRVPLPLDPNIVLAGIVPKECSVFKSAMLPLRLSFRIEAAPFNWRAPPLAADGAVAGGPTRGSAGAHPHHQHRLQHVHLTWHHPPGGAPSISSGAASSGGSGSGSGHHYSFHGLPADPLTLLPSRTGIVPAPSGAGTAAPAATVATAVAAAGGGGGSSHHGHSFSHHGHGHPGGPAPAPHGGPPPILDGYRCWLIYKKGDDLRQDHFILQMISLMDRMLKRENLDLRLTPYKVLPTSCDDGLLEFVPSVPLSAVLAEHRTIHRFLALTQADPTGPFGLRAEAVETFVRSCAGYCVMTYILGVGDRHLDNLMLTNDGRLFHIDFGYILGNDPKPFPPPMKLCKEMIEAMGGQGSEYYKQFRMFACEAYNILRKRADLILSLFHLMAGASIEAIRVDPEKAILKLQDKFRLDFDDEAAVEWMQGLINESATALLPQLVETTHRWAQYWR